MSIYLKNKLKVVVCLEEQMVGLKATFRIVYNLYILMGASPSYYVSRVELRNRLRLIHDPLCINVIMVCHASLSKYIPFC